MLTRVPQQAAVFASGGHFPQHDDVRAAAANGTLPPADRSVLLGARSVSQTPQVAILRAAGSSLRPHWPPATELDLDAHAVAGLLGCRAAAISHDERIGINVEPMAKKQKAPKISNKVYEAEICSGCRPSW